jgi:hypothetical protein
MGLMSSSAQSIVLVFFTRVGISAIVVSLERAIAKTDTASRMRKDRVRHS